MERKVILTIVVVYQNPLDYPDKFVAREQRTWSDGTIEAKKYPLAVGDTLESVREKIPCHLVHMQRHPTDALSIIETWI